MAKGAPSVAMVMDVTKATRPDAATRRQIVLRCKKIPLPISFMAIIAGKNLFLRVACRLILGRIYAADEYGIYKTYEQALTATRKRVAEINGDGK